MKIVDSKGRVWKSKKLKEMYERNISLYLHISLQLECYVDDTKDRSAYESEGFKTLEFLRANRNNLTGEELYNLTVKIIKEFNETVDELGREKFESFDDGDISYIGYESTKEKR